MTKSKKLTWRQQYNKYLNSIEVGEFTNERHITFPVYTKIPKPGILELKHIGKQLWIVNSPQNETVYLRKLNEDSVVIQFKGERIYRTLYRDEVMLHPDEWVIQGQTNEEYKQSKKEERLAKQVVKPKRKPKRKRKTPTSKTKTKQKTK